MSTHAHLPRNDLSPLSPTFADSAIDTDSDTDTDNDLDAAPRISRRNPLSDENHNLKTPEPQAVATQGIAERLAELTQRASSEGSSLSEDNTVVLRCLDILERTVSSPGLPGPGPAIKTGEDGESASASASEFESESDPRATFAREIAKYRPHSSTTTTTRSFHRSRGAPSPSTIQGTPIPVPGPVSAEATLHLQPEPQPKSQPQQSQIQLQHLVGQISALGDDLAARRNESSHIHQLFALRCRGLERSVDVLQAEIRDLTADIDQSAIERESLRGTVYGLESWVDGWHGEDVQRRWSRLNPRDRRMLQVELDVDCEALREGVRAWMRGWKDIDEGVKGREREREVRREARRGYTGTVVGCGDGE